MLSQRNTLNPAWGSSIAARAPAYPKMTDLPRRAGAPPGSSPCSCPNQQPYVGSVGGCHVRYDWPSGPVATYWSCTEAGHCSPATGTGSVEGVGVVGAGVAVGVAVGDGASNIDAPPPTKVRQSPQSSTTVNGTVTAPLPEMRRTKKLSDCGRSGNARLADAISV